MNIFDFRQHVNILSFSFLILFFSFALSRHCIIKFLIQNETFDEYLLITCQKFFAHSATHNDTVICPKIYLFSRIAQPTSVQLVHSSVLRCECN